MEEASSDWRRHSNIKALRFTKELGRTANGRRLMGPSNVYGWLGCIMNFALVFALYSSTWESGYGGALDSGGPSADKNRD